MAVIFFDALSLRLEIPQTPIDELSMMGYLAEFCDAEINFIPKGMTGYPLHARIELEEGSMIVRYGSTEFNMTLHIEAKGAGAELLRSFMLLHPAMNWVCTRADIACDFVCPKVKAIDMRSFRKAVLKPRSKYDAYWVMFKSLLAIAEKKNLAVSTYGQGWHDETSGRTFYIGSSGSASQFRLYEKSEERWKAGYLDYPAGVIRFEWQYRPQGVHRSAINELEPQAIIAINRTAVHLFEHVAGAGVEYTRVQGIKKSGDEATFIYALNQYKKTVTRLAQKRGVGWVYRQAKHTLGL